MVVLEVRDPATKVLVDPRVPDRNFTPADFTPAGLEVEVTAAPVRCDTLCALLLEVVAALAAQTSATLHIATARQIRLTVFQLNLRRMYPTSPNAMPSFVDRFKLRYERFLLSL